MPDYAHPESLVSTRWVADHLVDPAVRIVEVIWGDSVDWGTTAYRSGHIPGAVAWDFATDLQDSAHNDIVDQAEAEALLGRSGVTTCILGPLGAIGGKLLHDMGFTNVSILAGGVQAWIETGLPVAKNGSR